MGYIKGKIERISVGQPNTPKDPTWKKSAKVGLQINGEWHNFFVNEHNGAFTPKDKDYTDLKEGMEIEFMTEVKNVNGTDYENVNKSTIKALSSGIGQQPIPTEKVPETGAMTPQMASVAMTICNGMAAARALFKFGKNLPEDIDDKVNRMGKYYYKEFIK